MGANKILDLSLTVPTVPDAAVTDPQLSSEQAHKVRHYPHSATANRSTCTLHNQLHADMYTKQLSHGYQCRLQQRP